MTRTGSDDVSRSVSRVLRRCDGNKDCDMEEIGEEGQGGYSEWSVVYQPHFTNWLTYLSALRDQFPSSCPTRSHPRPNSQPTTTSATISAFIRRRCRWMKGDHRAEGPDIGEERCGVTMPLKCILNLSAHSHEPPHANT
ncbi:uncharacterized protein LACBIDRAFT_301911 [Laccaria bicolor S238N-H82]|uniref:Predicted protein n=1 Tax=Laccaria bicolor (strain S238N-H82 / ATCC MYA-4686) TaxID=486041 RepID=B0CPW6_LACBS|nr:uncharacterized protein LACBIDRAFT_301911 [Laccaria bicolor S238N-H82]EDR16137.1 predicted protein [Laccaria bicolor S238N-H82]|eukprot:XP_001874345.1 predicted protein [Laccaria bicolor S238N-H82]